MSSAPVHLLFTTDNRFCMPTAVALASLKANRNPGTSYRVHLFLHGVEKENRTRLLSLAEEGMEIYCYNCDVSRYTEEGMQGQLPPATFMRLEAPRLLPPEVERVLYLDGDILVKGDLSTLYETDLQGHTIGAVRDMLGERVYNARTHVTQGDYFNAGVLLMDVARMRAEGMAERLYSLLQRKPAHWALQDQDLLNAFFENDHICLPLVCNNTLQPFRTRLPYFQVDEINAFYGTSYANLNELDEATLVLHYAIPEKPWEADNGYVDTTWLHYLGLSPYAHCRLQLANYRDTMRYRLLGVPVLKVTCSAQERAYFLFHILPFWRVRRHAEGHVGYLFGVLPLLHVRRSRRKRRA